MFEEDETCSVCLKNVTSEKTNIGITACGHKFCLTCIIKAIYMSGNKCPMCRSPILDSFTKREMDVDAYIQSQGVVYESIFSNMYNRLQIPDEHLRIDPPPSNQSVVDL